jgi:hypothetical protein
MEIEGEKMNKGEFVKKYQIILALGFVAGTMAVIKVLVVLGKI